MRVNGFRCDACCKEHLLESTRLSQGFSEGFPHDWFMLTQGQYNHEREPLLFCSAKCLHDWAGKQLVHTEQLTERTTVTWEEW